MTTKYSLVKGVAGMPSSAEAIIMCPVLETGKNSVMPSTIARSSACQ